MLRSVDEIIEAVGGSTAAAELVGVGKSAASNWKAAGAIPAEYFVIFSEELERRNLAFDRGVFGFKRELT